MGLRDRWSAELTTTTITKMLAHGVGAVSADIELMIRSGRRTNRELADVRDRLDRIRDDINDLASELDTERRTARSGARGGN